MPFYQVFHSIDLSPEQKDALAIVITNAHSGSTGALKMFVNIEFYHNTNPWQYVGGMRRPNNKVIAMTRHRGELGDQLMTEVSTEILEGWNKVVGNEGENELSALWINDSMLTGIEFGASLPKAFEDQNWFETHTSDFERRAKAGDQLFIDALKDSVISR
ncbi:hypothetical protein H072_7309 [Dactylellina haptotyla CBS 200.50]|uniref:Tautomerase cis-CaaD-like domain-containing protein n=1 Tax=Dactylellina haptotyla (strain CBS 200.50) TaxID=1284197 RepID=S8A7Y2_DACHA|nr:hypothetical protein H072_7309 [Dactylellina haptotyla CBS 200.50]